jgi:hypothetical protein
MARSSTDRRGYVMPPSIVVKRSTDEDAQKYVHTCISMDACTYILIVYALPKHHVKKTDPTGFNVDGIVRVICLL